ncbi:MAG: carbohydrate binding family 9 domain-containing protein [Ignavibacteriales bacterium]|nr:MAG: carbohydrate binding family 9 domain-containing protein [Ignavibacteriales bacterium]
MKILILLLLVALAKTNAAQGETPKELKKTIPAHKISETIELDGALSEKIWLNAQGFSTFTQKDPVEGAPATEQTVVTIAYDAEAIYFGVKLTDSSPDSITARLARKDVYVDADMIYVYIDPYNDKRSGYYFALNAAGTMYDGVLYNDDWSDDSWDGVWDGKSIINEDGWSAEFKIPFSQLRFNAMDENTWGVNVKRVISRKNEYDYLVMVPKNESGFVSRFAELNGLENLHQPGNMEILPYITGRAEYTHPESNNPFNDGSTYQPKIGADFKTNLGTNLTLNATVFPDYGQVEIDPAVINLSDVETYFSEKRPFFIEGSTIFEFGQGGARNYWGFNWSNPNFFYSRRIGRVPQGSLPSSDYADIPSGTDILGAAKLTGKISNSWNIGTIQSLTSREHAEIDLNGNRSDVEIEPLTYYGIFRAQKEIDEGRQAIGFISTVTSRMFKDGRLRDEINSNAFTGGIDGWTFLDSSKTWVTTGWVGMSHITGSNERIINVQRNSQHYFQRPDLKTNRFDSTATSLTGYAGRIYLNKQKGNSFFNSAFGFVTPSFDVNDVGFIGRADVLNMHLGGGYSWKDPTDFYRYFELGGAVFRNYDFDGNITWHGIYHFGYYEFTNYYSINWNLAYNPESINNRGTRGGPLMRNHSGYQVSFYANSDSRKDWVVGLGHFRYERPDNSYEWSVDPELVLRPATNVSVTISPSYGKNIESMQYVGAVDDPLASATFGRRYLFGELDQTTFSAGIRLNWTFTPKLSLQLYVQPLISSGKYTNIKELSRPASYDFLIYGQYGSTINNETKEIDPDGSGPAQPFTISNPDFNFKSLRGNAVLRWEYLPGSVLYFVWTQSRSDFEELGEFQFKKSVNRLWDAKADNIFMVKFTYWLNM